MRHDVCAAPELRPGTMVETLVGARTVVIARTHRGHLYAFGGHCLHQGAPLSRGRLMSGVEGGRAGEYNLAEERELVKCPWHGYEYDLESGAALFDGRRRLRVFPVREVAGRIVIETREARCAG